MLVSRTGTCQWKHGNHSEFHPQRVQYGCDEVGAAGVSVRHQTPHLCLRGPRTPGAPQVPGGEETQGKGGTRGTRGRRCFFRVRGDQSG